MKHRTRQLVFALFLGSCLLLPAGNAFAGGCASAICVYREQQATPTGSRVLGEGSSKPAPLSRSAGQALARYKGKDKQAIKTLAKSPAYSIGHSRVASPPTGRAAHPVGTFDLGSGGTWLFYLLAISAGLVVIAAGLRLYRR